MDGSGLLERSRNEQRASSVKAPAEAKVVEKPLDSKGACDCTPRCSNGTALAKEA